MWEGRGPKPPSPLELGYLMNEVVDGALQGRLDEVVLQSSGGVLLQGLMGHVVGVGVDQAPLSADEVLVVLSLISSQEPGPLLFDVLGLSGVEVSLVLEDGIQEGVNLGWRP